MQYCVLYITRYVQFSLVMANSTPFSCGDIDIICISSLSMDCLFTIMTSKYAQLVLFMIQSINLTMSVSFSKSDSCDQNNAFRYSLMFKYKREQISKLQHKCCLATTKHDITDQKSRVYLCSRNGPFFSVKGITTIFFICLMQSSFSVFFPRPFLFRDYQKGSNKGPLLQGCGCFSQVHFVCCTCLQQL